MADITGSTFSDLPLTPTSASVNISSAALADLENVVNDFGILLLSYIKAVIMRYFMSTSGNESHL